MINILPRKLIYFLIHTFIFITIGCANQNTADSIWVTLLHMNDVYEIAPTSNGQFGGLARVSTLRKRLLKKNPNTITFMGGDFFSPSTMGTTIINGEKIAGKQMVQVLNLMGLDYATFGNHEFDLDREQFFQRIGEAKFTFVSANVRDEKGERFPNVMDQKILTFKNKMGDEFKIGFFGVTLNFNQAEYASYRDVLTTTSEQITLLKDETDFILALSHQEIRDDEKMISIFPEIDLLLGGHEHDNFQLWRGNSTPILKADANARSVYVVDIFFNPETGYTNISPRIVFIDTNIKEEPEIKNVIEQWTKKVFDTFKQRGFEPKEVLATISKPLDGLDASVRNRSTNLTKLIAESMLLPYPEAELSIFNSGSIRVDDCISTGDVTVYDILRTLPFEDNVALVEIEGDLLKRILNQGLSNSGSGGYLHWANVKYTGQEWFVKGEKINDSRSYKVAIIDFLLLGRETGLRYLNRENPDVIVLNEGKQWDIRQLVVDKLKTLKNYSINH